MPTRIFVEMSNNSKAGGGSVGSGGVAGGQCAGDGVQQEQQQQDDHHNKRTTKMTMTLTASREEIYDVFPPEVRNSIKEMEVLELAYWELWLGRFVQLKKFHSLNNHTKVPKKYEPAKNLPRWVATQRAVNRQGKMHPARKRLLENIMFDFEPRHGRPRGRSSYGTPPTKESTCSNGQRSSIAVVGTTTTTTTKDDIAVVGTTATTAAAAVGTTTETVAVTTTTTTTSGGTDRTSTLRTTSTAN